MKIPAGQTMESYVQATAHAQPTDANAIPFFKARRAMPASINTIMTPIAPRVIKVTVYSISAPHVRAEEIHLRPVKSALTDTSKIPTTIALPLDAPSVKTIILDHLLTP